MRKPIFYKIIILKRYFTCRINLGLYAQTKKQIREQFRSRRKRFLARKKRHRTPTVILSQASGTNVSSLRLNTTDANTSAATSLLGSENNSNNDDESDSSSLINDKDDNAKHKMQTQLQEVINFILFLICYLCFINT